MPPDLQPPPTMQAAAYTAAGAARYLAPQAAAADAEQQEHLTPEYWAKEIAASKKWLQKWHTRAKTIERKYLLADQDSDQR